MERTYFVSKWDTPLPPTPHQFQNKISRRCRVSGQWSADISRDPGSAEATDSIRFTHQHINLLFASLK